MIILFFRNVDDAAVVKLHVNLATSSTLIDALEAELIETDSLDLGILQSFVASKLAQRQHMAIPLARRSLSVDIGENGLLKLSYLLIIIHPSNMISAGTYNGYNRRRSHCCNLSYSAH